MFIECIKDGVFFMPFLSYVTGTSAGIFAVIFPVSDGCFLSELWMFHALFPENASDFP